MSKDMLKRVQTLQQYMCAMKDGDIETVATLLEDAEQDRALENMFLEVNATYQEPVQQNDIVQAQDLMLTIAHQPIRRDTMQRPLLHTEDDSAQLPTVGTTQQVRSADQVRTGRNALPSAFTARAAAKRMWYRSPKSWIVALAAAILLFFVILQSNGVLAGQPWFFHQEKPVIMNIDNTKGPYIGAFNLGSFSDKSGFFAHGPYAQYSPFNIPKSQLMHSINFPLMLPTQLPENLKGTKPEYGIVDGGFATFTFSSAEAHAYLAKYGYGNVPIPAILDGATFRMGRATAAQIYYSSGRYELMVTEGALYNIQATGNASVKDLDNFMLLLPLSPLVKAEYTQNNGDMLEPIPTNAGAKITSVTVHHVPGFLVTGKNLEGPMLSWEENGIEYSIDWERGMNESQVLALANSFHS